jgi:branched-chain amino acid transport system substrate-binding protein
MNKKILIGIGVAIVIVFGIWTIFFRSQSNVESIKIGAILPLSGDLASYAEGSRNAAILAIEDSGLKDRVQFIIEDDKNCAPVDGVSAAQKLLNVDKVNALFGPMCSSEVEAVLPLSEPLKIPVISAAATAKTLSGKGKYFFRTVASNSVNADSIANFIYEKGYRKASFLFDNSQDALIQEKNDAKDTFIKNGGVIVSEDSFTTSSKDFRTLLLKVKSSGADVIFIASFYKELALILTQAVNLNIQAQFVALDESTDVKDFFTLAGNASKGVYVSTASIPSNEESKSFSDRYKNRFGVNPITYSAESYDAMMLLLKAIIAGGVSGDNIKSNILRIGNNYSGASGLITFQANGDVQKPGVIKVSNGSEFIVVK